MSTANRNSQMANAWAEKKRLQMEKAKKIREERKMKMQMAAENNMSEALPSKPPPFGGFGDAPSYGEPESSGIPDMSSSPPSGAYQRFSNKNVPAYGASASNYRPSSNEELTEARQSLLLLKSKMKVNPSKPAPMNAAPYGRASQQMDSGKNANYRKVFKPNLGGSSQTNRSKAFNQQEDEITRNTYHGQSKPISRPPVNNRLKPKLGGGKYGGMANDIDENHVQYEPSKRTGSLRSSRIVDSRERQSRPFGNDDSHEIDNIPRASKLPNHKFGGATNSSSKPKYGGVPKNKGKTTRAAPSHMSSGLKPSGLGASSNPYDNDFGDEAYEQPSSLKPCPSCGRSFNAESFAKHKKVCQKVFQNKRKKFNTQSQRIVDGEHKEILKTVKKEERKFGGLRDKNKRTGALPGSKKSKWQKQSAMFRNAMRAARGAKPLNEGFGGGAGGGAADDEEDNDFVKCPTCGRTFNENAANRHIPSCAEKAKQAAMRMGPAKRGRGKPMGRFR